jgi:glucosamine--fructose-6-phosphate aminotransferase (isomerizing)
MKTESRLRREIFEQPSVLARLLETQRPAAEALAEAVRRRGVSNVVIAARGTSDNAGRYAQYLFGAMNGLVVALATPSLFTYYRRVPRFHNTLVIGISQSGRSPDVIAVLAEARRQGALTAVVTNDRKSPMAAHGDVTIDLCAAEERAVAATKTYTAELAAIALLSTVLAGDAEMAGALERLPGAVGSALAADQAAAQAARGLREIRRAVVLGRGFNYATAFEVALKLEELTYTSTEAFSSADFRHGPMAMVEPGFPAIVVAATGPLLEDLRSVMATLRAGQAEVLCITDDPSTASEANVALRVPCDVPEWLSPATLVIPGQLLALHLATLRGHDVDAPRAIRKITETY